MEAILSLLGLVASLLMVVQNTPNLPPEVRANAIIVATQALKIAADYQVPAQAPIIVQPTAQQTPAPVSQPVTPPTSGATITPMPETPTGVVTASIQSQKQTVHIGESRIILAEILIKNDRTEGVQFFGNENASFKIIENTVDGWSSTVRGAYKNVDLLPGPVNIPAGTSGILTIFLDTSPTATGSFKLSTTAYKMIGQTSGDYVDVAGFPLDFGTVTVVQQ